MSIVTDVYSISGSLFGVHQPTYPTSLTAHECNGLSYCMVVMSARPWVVVSHSQEERADFKKCCIIYHDPSSPAQLDTLLLMLTLQEV